MFFEPEVYRFLMVVFVFYNIFISITNGYIFFIVLSFLEIQWEISMARYQTKNLNL